MCKSLSQGEICLGEMALTAVRGKEQLMKSIAPSAACKADSWRQFLRSKVPLRDFRFVRRDGIQSLRNQDAPYLASFARCTGAGGLPGHHNKMRLPQLCFFLQNWATNLAPMFCLTYQTFRYRVTPVSCRINSIVTTAPAISTSSRPAVTGGCLCCNRRGIAICSWRSSSGFGEDTTLSSWAT